MSLDTGGVRILGTPSRARTCGLRFRKPTLYPTELWARWFFREGNITRVLVLWNKNSTAILLSHSTARILHSTQPSQFRESPSMFPVPV